MSSIQFGYIISDIIIKSKAYFPIAEQGNMNHKVIYHLPGASSRHYVSRRKWRHAHNGSMESASGDGTSARPMLRVYPNAILRQPSECTVNNGYYLYCLLKWRVFRLMRNLFLVNFCWGLRDCVFFLLF